MTQNYDLTTGSIAKKLVLFFIPIAVGTLFQQLYNTVDAMVVGKFVGTEALAAVGGSAAQIIGLFIGFFVALTGGASAVIAQLAGARQEEDVSQAVHSAFSFSILAGIALMIVGIPMTPTVLRWMQTPADTMAQSILYLQIYFSGSVFMLLFNMGSSILQAIGDSKHPLYYLIACCFCNIILDLVFVIGFKMGTAGVACATVLSQLLSCILVMQRFFRAKTFYRLTLSQLRIHPGIMKKMLLIGIPSGLQASMYSISNLIIQVAINSLMTVAVAAWSVSSKVDGIHSAITTALGVAVMGFVGQNYGAGKEDRVRETLRVAQKIFFPVTMVLSAVVLLFSAYGLHLFIDDPEVISTTQRIMLYFAPFYIIWTFIEILTGSLRGIGDAFVPLIITVIGICVLRLIWVATLFPIFHVIDGLCACYPISWAITALALYIYYRRQGWHKARSKSAPKEAE